MECSKCGNIQRYHFCYVGEIDYNEMVRQMINKQESPPHDPCDKCKSITIQQLIAYSYKSII